MATAPNTLLAEVTGWVGIITALEPLAAPVIAGFINLIKKHPEVTLDQWIQLMTTVATAVHSENADTRDTVKKDQQDHPLPPDPPAPASAS